MTNPTDTVDAQVLTDILINLVTVPEEVAVERKIDEQGVLLSVRVNAKDMGIVIGRSGGMAMAIKTIMRAVGKANKMNIRVQFLEPDGSLRHVGKFDAESSQEDFLDNDSGFKTQSPARKVEAKVSDTTLDDDLEDFVIN